MKDHHDPVTQCKIGLLDQMLTHNIKCFDDVMVHSTISTILSL